MKLLSAQKTFVAILVLSVAANANAALPKYGKAGVLDSAGTKFSAVDLASINCFDNGNGNGVPNHIAAIVQSPIRCRLIINGAEPLTLTGGKGCIICHSIKAIKGRGTTRFNMNAETLKTWARVRHSNGCKTNSEAWILGECRVGICSGTTGGGGGAGRRGAQLRTVAYGWWIKLRS